MRVTVNGEARELFEAETLDAAITELGYGGARVAAALDGDFVPRRSWGDARLDEGSRIEILAPMQGG